MSSGSLFQYYPLVMTNSLRTWKWPSRKIWFSHKTMEHGPFMVDFPSYKMVDLSIYSHANVYQRVFLLVGWNHGRDSFSGFFLCFFRTPDAPLNLVALGSCLTCFFLGLETKWGFCGISAALSRWSVVSADYLTRWSGASNAPITSVLLASYRAINPDVAETQLQGRF